MVDSTHAKVLQLLEGKKGRVLDAGAGDGGLTKHLVKQFSDVEACDILQKSAFKCDCDYKNVNLNQKWPYKDKSFDVVCLVEVIEHVENPWHTIREAKRVLKKGGTLVMTTPNVMNLLSRVTFLLKGRFFCFGVDEFKINHHLNPITWYELEIILKQENMVVEQLTANKMLNWREIKKAASVLMTLPLFLLLKPKNRVLQLGEILVIRVVKE